MKSKLKLIGADGHRISGIGLHAYLSEKEFVKQIVISDTGKGLLQMLEDDKYDILILGEALPDMDSGKLLRDVKEHFPKLKIVIFTSNLTNSFIRQMLHIGVHGYLSKRTAPEELQRAFKSVMKGERFYCKIVAGVVFNQFLDRKEPHSDEYPSISVLSEREAEILKLVVEEYTSMEIAGKLDISPRTVDSHRRNIMEKLGVNTLVGLIKRACLSGLI